MTEENTLEQESASFADMLAAHEEEQSAARLEVGQKVKATVVAITSDTVFVSTGSKVDGLVEKSELEQDGVSTCAVGDVLDLYVVHVSPQEVRLSKVVRGAGSLNILEDAYKGRLPVEGKVTAQVKGGFSVEIMRRRAFCPLSQFDVRPVDNPEAYLGKTLNFVITKLEQSGRNIVLSRRSLLEAEQAEGREAFLAKVQVGDVLEGAVQRLTPFGAFVELAPGVDGMVHVSELSWSRVTQPDEVLAVGDKVRVKLLGIDQADKADKAEADNSDNADKADKPEKGARGHKGNRGARISLSIRQITEDPWQSVAERLHAGDTLTGKVLRLTSFGAFIEVLPGIEGLAHLSELSWEKRVNKADEVLTVGEEVSVKVKEVDSEKRRVSLSVRDVAGDPWSRVPEDFPLESEHTGRLEKRAAFGLFINLAPGITGLMPNSLINSVRGRSKFAKLAPGEEVTVRINEMDLANRKLTLGAVGEDAEVVAPQREARSGQTEGGQGDRADRSARPDRGDRAGAGKGDRGRPRRDGRPGRDEDSDWKKHAQSSSAGAGGAGGFSILGSALAEAMQKKKESK
ncbi:MAG: S1 RNA-binding domain-containing protein [Deltaproteobacteria bacterium]|jgi:small subunit ribosomal protein S1|nr:S1 RNA-binding domain-containing protein [Deltaproteobacteria bacterium]